MTDPTQCGTPALVPDDHSAEALGDLMAPCRLPAGHSGDHSNGMAVWRTTGGTRLRRLPWSNDADPAFVAPGDGFVNRLADTLEGQMIETAEGDATKARELAADPDATAEEMRKALGYLAGSLRDAALIAVLRGERLGMDSVPAGESYPADQPLYGERARAVGQALRRMRPGRGQ